MRMLIPALIAASLAAFTSCTGGPAPTDPGAAIAASGRPASDKALDAQRRGPEILAFADVRPGWKIGDLMQGAGYFTRLWVSAAGADGRVYAWSPPEFIEAKKALYGDSLDQLVREYPTHVVPLRMAFDDLAFPGLEDAFGAATGMRLTACLAGGQMSGLRQLSFCKQSRYGLRNL